MFCRKKAGSHILYLILNERSLIDGMDSIQGRLDGLVVSALALYTKSCVFEFSALLVHVGDPGATTACHSDLLC